MPAVIVCAAAVVVFGADGRGQRGVSHTIGSAVGGGVGSGGAAAGVGPDCVPARGVANDVWLCGWGSSAADWERKGCGVLAAGTRFAELGGGRAAEGIGTVGGGGSK